jgi:S1-C subfamily serine protease
VRLCYAAPLVAMALLPAISVAQDRSAGPDVFKKASPTLVTISTSDAFGSGVLIDPSGVIVTNLHVIRGAEKATVRLASGETYDAVAVVGVDPVKDLALVKIAGASFPVAELRNGADESAIGDTVYAIGAPKGLELTMSEGIVSGKRDSPGGYRLIQTSAALSSGSSGGGLFDDAGRLVGITTSKIDDGENLNFAIPIRYVRDILPGTATWTLPELNAHLVATSAPSGTSASPLTTTLGGIPQLASFYTNTLGQIAVVRQTTGGRLRVSFRSAGFTVGSAELQWDASRKGFAGNGTYKALCGGEDRRAWDVPIEQEVFFLNDKVIRVRWMQPVAVDCSKGVIRSYSAQDVVWFVPSPE